MGGYALKREDRSQKDLHISLIDYENPEANHFRLVNQMEIVGTETRIPDAILYINGLLLVVFEFKSAIRTEVTLFNAYEQLTVRYSRDIPELMKYNALCIISDGVNSKMGSLFAPYEFFYTWRKITGKANAAPPAWTRFWAIRIVCRPWPATSSNTTRSVYAKVPRRRARRCSSAIDATWPGSSTSR